METGLDNVKRALGVFRNSRLSAREQLERGSQLIWSATYFRDDWPYALQREINDIFATLRRYGSVKTAVRQLPDDEFDFLVAEMLDWAINFEHAYSITTEIDVPATHPVVVEPPKAITNA